MATINLLYKKYYEINDSIKVYIPTVGEILENEDDYYNLVSMFTVMPIDMMVQLDDVGIDFTSINEYELFLLLFNGFKDQDTSLVLGDLDLSKFEISVNQENENVVLYDAENDIVIDRALHGKIASTLRKIHHFERNNKEPGNEEAKKFMLERARKKQKRNRNRKQFSQIESLIIAMVNANEFKYDFEGTKGLSIYQFNESVRQVIKRVDYDNKMFGIYTGNINPKEMKQDELNWLTHK